MPAPTKPSKSPRQRYLDRISAAIRAARTADGMSMAAAARELGVKFGTYRRWEYGLVVPPADVRENMAVLWAADRKQLGLDVPDACPHCGRA